MENCTTCGSKKLRYVKYPMRNGVEQLRKQCFDCGYLNTKNHKRNSVHNFNVLPYFSERLRNKFSEKCIQKREAKKVLFEYAQNRFLKQVEYYRNVYLNSDEWKHKRKLVMDVHNWKCQECGNDATDLHHNTYERIFREKFDDLTPLCRDCHSKKHTEWNLDHTK